METQSSLTSLTTMGRKLVGKHQKKNSATPNLAGAKTTQKYPGQSSTPSKTPKYGRDTIPTKTSGGPRSWTSPRRTKSRRKRLTRQKNTLTTTTSEAHNRAQTKSKIRRPRRDKNTRVTPSHGGPPTIRLPRRENNTRCPPHGQSQSKPLHLGVKQLQPRENN